MARDDSDRAFDELQDILQQAILTEYQNPERKGCPGTAVIRELANRPKPNRDAPWQHVTHCSPCYREFLDIRSQVLRREQAQRTSRRRLSLAIAASIVVAVGIAAYALFSTNSKRTGFPAQYEAAVLDLTSQTSVRGDQSDSPPPPKLSLPAKALDLRIDLPIGSEPGEYQIQFLKSEGIPLIRASGIAAVQSGMTVLHARLTLGSYAPGDYFIGIRRSSSNWIFYPVAIK